MSLVPKVDEVSLIVRQGMYDFVSLVETWMQNHIHDNVIAIDGYHVIRRDRQEGQHGGICMYIKNSIVFSVLDELSATPFEVLWINLRPNRLPRGYSNLVIGTVYHPPCADNNSILEYLSQCLSSIESWFPNCGILIIGDFNKLNTKRLQSSYNLKQIVKFPTRGNNTLDLVLTNMKDFYDSPNSLPPFGLSDHVSIEAKPRRRSQLQQASKIKVKSRDLRPSNRFAMRSYLELVDVKDMVGSVELCEEKVTMLESIVKTGMEYIIPLRPKTIQISNPPWLNSTLIKLIRKRQKAFNKGNTVEFKRLRNRVNRERKNCRARYYEASVKHLRSCKPNTWWKEVKKLCGMKSPNGTSHDCLSMLKNIEESSGGTTVDLANKINNAFLSPMRNFAPLTRDFSTNLMSNFNENQPNEILSVSTEEVRIKLASLNPQKAQGPDSIPAWLLKENADLFAYPVMDILNCSYKSGCLPSSWKEANIVPIPKQKLVLDVNKHLRPISLTPIISKLAEDFVVERYVKPAVMQKIDQHQYGTVPKSCTSYALISIIHSWTEGTDGNGSTVRVMVFDFQKAFDLIDHCILADKLSSYNIPRSIVCWILDFLLDRKQRVRLSTDCYSEWGYVPAGVPQGIKLGPWLFAIMVNDLNVTGVEEFWKYVDDTTMAELVPKNTPSMLQNSVDEFTRKSQANKFRLNEDKCKEFRIDFSKSNQTIAPIIINNKTVEVVPSVKLLGLTLTDNLKWNAHIMEVCKKVASRLYFLRQLKRARVPANDLLQFYLSCIRSVVEYACVVFHDSLPQYLSNDLESLQKRAFRIIYPELSYRDALERANVPSLYNRRQLLTDELFNNLVVDSNHKLHNLLPPLNHSLPLRNSLRFYPPICKTNRFKNTFIIKNSYKYFA